MYLRLQSLFCLVLEKLYTALASLTSFKITIVVQAIYICAVFSKKTQGESVSKSCYMYQWVPWETKTEL